MSESLYNKQEITHQEANITEQKTLFPNVCLISSWLAWLSMLTFNFGGESYGFFANSGELRLIFGGIFALISVISFFISKQSSSWAALSVKVRSYAGLNLSLAIF